MDSPTHVYNVLMSPRFIESLQSRISVFTFAKELQSIDYGLGLRAQDSFCVKHSFPELDGIKMARQQVVGAEYC